MVDTIGNDIAPVKTAMGAEITGLSAEKHCDNDIPRFLHTFVAGTGSHDCSLPHFWPEGGNDVRQTDGRHGT